MASGPPPIVSVTPADPAAPTANDSPPPPPSPTVVGDSPQRTTLALRDNNDPNAKLAAHEATTGDANSLGLTATTESGDSPKRGHGRKPSEAVSFTSTVPDTSEKRAVKDEEAGVVEDDGEAPKRRLCGLLPPKKEKAPKVLAAKPDPSPEEMKPFPNEIVPSSLYALIDPKSIDHLRSLGGTEGLLKSLGSDRKTGLVGVGAGGGGDKGITLEDRLRVFGPNRVPERKSKSLLQLMWMAYQDKVLLVLSVAAVVSLALGLYQDLGAPPKFFESTRCPPTNLCEEASVDWVEGVAITAAIFIVVVVGAVNDYQKERQFRKLNAQKEERFVKVLRDGQEKLISVYDTIIGDVCLLEPGEILPVDGVFLEGHNVKCDESGATGESDALKKVPFEELEKDLQSGKASSKADCFMISGSKVLEGVGRYLVTGVGERSFHGRIMMSLRGENEDTPLQLKLNRLAELIAKIGSTAGLILFGSLMIRFFVELGRHPERSANDKAQNFIQILIISVTVVVVAVPEGLPLAVTLALAFATRRMTKQNLLVRVLGACETMANATVICTDKTGTLTENRMSVVAGAIGVHLKFADRLTENKGRSNANEEVNEDEITAEGGSKEEQIERERQSRRLDFSTEMSDINQHIPEALKALLNESVAINSTAFEGTDEHGAEGGFVGSKTETALLTWAKVLGWPNYKEVRESAKVVQMVPFSSERKAMGVVVELPTGGYRLYLKGASEVLGRLCTRHVVVEQNGSSGSAGLQYAEFNAETRANIDRTIIFYANQSLRTIALCSRDMDQWPPADAKRDENGDVLYNDFARDLSLVAITAIEDPLREGVTEAVRTCQGAGVQVKMCTGDNVLTARSIATQCGIFSAGGVIMEGPAFRKLTPQERDQIVPRLQVLARSSPEDKKILVEHLKGMGEVVGVTGDGTNDGPALKTANVGFSMGIAGTEVAKEASDIILMDDNFASIVSAIMWGRCVNDSVKKFLQFQISVNITAVIITFITAVSSDEEESVLTAVQLLWVNLIMDTFAALALATDPATPEVLKRKPDRRGAPLITSTMWMHIVGQAIFQIITSLVLHFAGHQILGHDPNADTAVRLDDANNLKTLVFNTFVFCQIFNQFNARRLDGKQNIFAGIHKNIYFVIIFCIMVGGQVLIVNVGGAAFQVTRIGGRDWGISIVVGALSLPIGAVLRTLPTGPWERFLIKLRLYPDPNAVLPTTTPGSDDRQWNAAITKAVDNLSTFSQIRGGRMRSSSMVLKSRSRRMKDADIHPVSLLAMVPGLVMSSVGAGWRPTEGGSLSDPAGQDPSVSSAHLYAGGAHVPPAPTGQASLAPPSQR